MSQSAEGGAGGFSDGGTVGTAGDGFSSLTYTDTSADTFSGSVAGIGGIGGAS